MKKVILLPIEIASRELLSKALLANRFANKDCIVFLGDKQSILEISNYTKESIFFDKGYHKNISENIYNNLKKNSIKIVSLDEENAVDFKDFQQLDLRFPDHLIPEFALIFLWGQKQYNYLRKNRDNFKEQDIFVTGHPRFDLLKDNLNSIYYDDANKIRASIGKFILVNTNFGLGNNIKGDEFIIRNYGSRFPQIHDLVEYQKMQVNNFIHLCHDISCFNEFNIVLRPHPEEDMKIYEESFKKKKNISVIKEGSVIPWIMSSDLMIHHDCTTSIESAMLGKSSIAYTNNLNRDLTTDIPLRVSYDYNSIEEIKEHISNIDLKDNHFNQEILNDYFNFYGSSIEQILNATLNISIKSPEIKKYHTYKIIRLIKDFLRSIFKKGDPLHEKKIEGLNEVNLVKVFKKYDSLFNTEIKIKKVHRRLFKITNEI